MCTLKENKLGRTDPCTCNLCQKYIELYMFVCKWQQFSMNHKALIDRFVWPGLLFCASRCDQLNSVISLFGTTKIIYSLPRL